VIGFARICSPEDTTKLRASIRVVLENAKCLFDDATFLEEWGRFPTAHALCILAQEEYGKAFLLYLVEKQSVPWTAGLQKALRHHQCKQLVALLMEYLQRKDFLELLGEPDRFRGASTLPEHIIDVIQIIVHEHIRECDRDEWLDADQKVHPVANRIARGMLDREKQAGFYVHVGVNGAVRKAPTIITAERCREEIARTKRVAECFYVHKGAIYAGASFDLPKIVATFEVLTGVMAPNEFNEKWWG
jgi:AbiV family abortive infection protein